MAENFSRHVGINFVGRGMRGEPYRGGHWDGWSRDYREARTSALISGECVLIPWAKWSKGKGRWMKEIGR